ncbi:acyl-CoA carboxylase subunit epsilon [Cellulomonas fimi]|uniref:Acyl-CoA carboxylase epsilon subunit n=1 Tax=Cellulomonas fimi (strain ATCC 484 / DSM 20113 / JCM 1341 / CCUG 24087 / LMG 16345 / NBRC 15513 / NCIMB 8980 / NCTC 7547 / NRS-133) TaxID=590998 RepID=F4H803_CELFA|nr:acyl-CoA carboxylase subunit epsilon [Cellulomonas fimi]AEE46964.1 hypothetical protein Celf_2842 [Cellulomonas fimi ATCC 484]NNH08215.1 acyl-CoA carboxylase subunit epsilon [Cellulomonas fimi]VEH34707.1 Uncharacterised protein [Cellulomonas fimi]
MSTDGAHVHVVRGAPDEVELAALVAGLVAASQDAHGVDEHTAPASAWSDRRRTVRGPVGLHPGPDAWRWSLRG